MPNTLAFLTRTPMKTQPILLLVSLLCFTLTACTLIDPNETSFDALAGERAVFEGRFTQGFEDSIFKPCGQDEAWFLTADSTTLRTFIRQSADALGQSGNPVYARLQGTLSLKGEYPGIFITYDRTLTVTEVLDVRPLRTNDCR